MRYYLWPGLQARTGGGAVIRIYCREETSVPTPSIGPIPSSISNRRLSMLSLQREKYRKKPYRLAAACPSGATTGPHITGTAKRSQAGFCGFVAVTSWWGTGARYWPQRQAKAATSGEGQDFGRALPTSMVRRYKGMVSGAMH